MHVQSWISPPRFIKSQAFSWHSHERCVIQHEQRENQRKEMEVCLNFFLVNFPNEIASHFSKRDCLISKTRLGTKWVLTIFRHTQMEVESWENQWKIRGFSKVPLKETI